MTDQDQHALSERIATLAEQTGLSAELLWEAAETCPQGHSNRDVECGYIELSIGDLCRECWTEEWRNPRLEVCATDAEIDAVVDEEMAAYSLFDDPTFHPEWRIGRQSRDLTDPTVLLAVVDAWLSQAMRYRDVILEWQGGIGQWSAEFATLTPGEGWSARPTYDANRTVAEAEALCAALEAGKVAPHADD